MKFYIRYNRDIVIHCPYNLKAKDMMFKSKKEKDKTVDISEAVAQIASMFCETYCKYFRGVINNHLICSYPNLKDKLNLLKNLK